jgi:hypothetical protein
MRVRYESVPGTGCVPGTGHRHGSKIRDIELRSMQRASLDGHRHGSKIRDIELRSMQRASLDGVLEGKIRRESCYYSIHAYDEKQ